MEDIKLLRNVINFLFLLYNPARPTLVTAAIIGLCLNFVAVYRRRLMPHQARRLLSPTHAIIRHCWLRVSYCRIDVDECNEEIRHPNSSPPTPQSVHGLCWTVQLLQFSRSATAWLPASEAGCRCPRLQNRRVSVPAWTRPKRVYTTVLNECLFTGRYSFDCIRMTAWVVCTRQMGLWVLSDLRWC